MNTRAFLIAIIIIVAASILFILFSNRQPAGREGSLANVDITATPEVVATSPIPKGNEALQMRKTDEEKLTYTLFEQNNSGISGKVDIKEENGKVVAIVTLEDGKSGNYPAHFHTGSCESPGPIVFPLKNIQNGSSQTTLAVSQSEFEAQLPLILNVHKSEKEMGLYISCGVIASDSKERLDYP